MYECELIIIAAGFVFLVVYIVNVLGSGGNRQGGGGGGGTWSEHPWDIVLYPPDMLATMADGDDDGDHGGHGDHDDHGDDDADDDHDDADDDDADDDDVADDDDDVADDAAAADDVAEDAKKGGGMISAGERACKEMLENLFKQSFLKVRPSFLRNPSTGRNLELDCYNADLRIALEYHGAQHYYFTPYFHITEAGFHAQQQRDLLKRQLCREHGILLIEVPYTVPTDGLSDYIRSKLFQKN
jgi:hypothetical protein